MGRVSENPLRSDGTLRWLELIYHIFRLLVLHEHQHVDWQICNLVHYL